jgi:hypothetical protein
MQDYDFIKDPIILLILSLFSWWLIPLSSTFNQNLYAFPTFIAFYAFDQSGSRAKKSGDGLRAKDYILLFLTGLMTLVSGVRWLGLI